VAEIPIDRGAAGRALEAALVRGTLMLGGVTDTGVQIAGSEWTVRDAAAHLISYASLWSGAFAGEKSPVEDLGRLARVNERLLSSVTERSGRELADRLRHDYDEVLRLAEDVPDGARVAWHQGADLDVPGALALALSEVLVHGYDIARAVGAPWRITPHDAGVAVAGGTRLVHLAVDEEKAAGMRLVCAVRLRTMPEFALVVDRRAATVECPPESPPDCRVSGDPVSYLLVGYGRKPRWRAALRGRLRAGGRNPWLVSRLSQVVTLP
jgi:uncharacterized protein (TIGR03083 family)